MASVLHGGNVADSALAHVDQPQFPYQDTVHSIGAVRSTDINN